MSVPRTTEALEREGQDHLLVQRFCLRVVDGPGTGLCHHSRRERLLVGTHRSVDFLLHDPTMSRFHCEIALAAGQPVVTDLGSRNGTLVDGVSVHRAPLRDGAVLSLGRTRLRFEAGGLEVKVPLSERERFGLLVGRSAAMRAVFARLEHASASDVPVLLLGETGTGKDAAAESIHRESARSGGPFVVVDCGAVRGTLIESELFGHERGAFTGADRDRPGAFEAAHGGTLFLDEVGELPLELQPKLLRALDRRTILRLGGNQRISVDIRIIAATNRDLRREVNARRFRSDLYYRLAVLPITLPPLRERKDDLPLLVPELLAQLGGGGRELVGPEFLDELRRHHFAGNIRELRNHLESRLTLREAATLDPTPPYGVDAAVPLRAAQEQFVRSYLEKLLALHDGNASEAARAAGIARSQLYRLLERTGLR